MSLADDLRPQSYDQVVGQEKAINQVKFLESKRGLTQRAIWISGLSGTGKTSIAQIIAEKISPNWWKEFDGKNVTPKDFVEWRQSVQCRPMLDDGYCLIVNEVHCLSSKVIILLLNMLEKLPDYVCVIFTTTKEGELSLFEDNIDASPLTSRCSIINLESRGEKLETAFSIYLRKISREHGLGDRPLQDYVALVRRHKFNLRACIQSLESGEML
jgi:replication-associated recombination protein RarA